MKFVQLNHSLYNVVPYDKSTYSLEAQDLHDTIEKFLQFSELSRLRVEYVYLSGSNPIVFYFKGFPNPNTVLILQDYFISETGQRSSSVGTLFAGFVDMQNNRIWRLAPYFHMPTPPKIYEVFNKYCYRELVLACIAHAINRRNKKPDLW